ncbi:Fe-S cluster assembly protein NifU [Allocoleopsis franciscana]|uniref:Nitrogen fixation protein NifU n=1 Tax=Allocoleopsis franciscana PCC 7113 TaxID=1173027 RepID=K9WBP2_9CYAN|nr:Fe-S cluster assembly protein NifU [Allocoleopsis franciscana]AFZ17179.1 Modular FeS cluster scaffolding protein NifU [Allocoleopsis franciscana PCC 7113]
MWDYTDKVMELFYNPKNQGALEDKDESGIAVVFGEVGSIACGDALRLHLKIEVDSDTILDSRFQTFGCTSAIASSSALTEIIKGKTLDQALNITNKDIAEFLGGLPEAKMHCSVMGQEALEAAIYNYRGIPLVTHEDDDEGALICSCFGISEAKIRRVIRENSLTTAEQVTSYVKAGGGCGSCLAGIDDLLSAVGHEAALAAEREMSVRVASDLATAKAQGPLTTVQKIALIQQVINEEVKPVLALDGGDVELFDVEGDRVLVQLKGACGSCSSSTATLKIAIEARLQERVLPSLVVEAV